MEYFGVLGEGGSNLEEESKEDKVKSQIKIEEKIFPQDINASQNSEHNENKPYDSYINGV